MSGSSQTSDAGRRPPVRLVGKAERVVAFVTDAPSEAALRAGLVEATAELEVRRGDITDAVKFVEREHGLRILLVDISGIENPVSALDQLAHVCPPDVTVLAIGTSADIGLYRSLVHDLGVTEYLPKPLTRDSVSRLFGAHVGGGEGAREVDRGGKLVLVCGAGGGSGASTIALSLATLLSRDMHSHVALLDLHLRHGTLALMSGIKTGPGLRIALEDPDRVDPLFLDRVSVSVDERLRVIAANEPLSQDMQVTDGGVIRVVDFLRQKFNFVVVDLPMPPPAASHLLAIARHVVLVMRPDVASLRDAHQIRQYVASQSTGSQMITVLNHSNMTGGLAPDLIEQTLGSTPDVTIPELGKNMVKSANMGKAAVREVPALARALGPLMQEVSGGVLGGPAKSGLFAWRKG